MLHFRPRNTLKKHCSTRHGTRWWLVGPQASQKTRNGSKLWIWRCWRLKIGTSWGAGGGGEFKVCKIWELRGEGWYAWSVWVCLHLKSTVHCNGLHMKTQHATEQTPILFSRARSMWSIVCLKCADITCFFFTPSRHNLIYVLVTRVIIYTVPGTGVWWPDCHSTFHELDQCGV